MSENATPGWPPTQSEYSAMLSRVTELEASLVWALSIAPIPVARMKQNEAYWKAYDRALAALTKERP